MPDISKEWERIREMATTGRDEAFGSHLRRLREAAGLTQEELAQRAGLSPMAIGMLERGQRRRPYPHTIQALGAALGLSEEEHAELAAAVPKRGETPSTPAPSLPVPLTPIIGRERELEEITGLVRWGARLLTLTGSGGVGKTRLAVQAAEHLSDTYPDGVVFVALAPLSDATLVVPTVARTLGLVDAAGRPPLEILRAYLRNRRLLLVLDNFEHVAEAAPEVADLTASCPALVVLVTSRAPLRVRGEQEYPVAPLALPDLERVPEVEEVAGNPAVELFVERARGVAPDFGLTRENATAVAAICRRLDGLPLAIELAAARIRTLSPTALLARLDPVLPLLTGGARDLPERQRTMSATLDWSHDLLSNSERALFRRLSAFAGGLTLEAAEAVGADMEGRTADVLGLIGGLVEQSLVTAKTDAGGERYEMLEPVRQYASEKLEGSGEAEETWRRHASFFLRLAERARPELRGSAQVVWLERLEHENGNLRATMGWALSAGEVETAARLGWALWLFWVLRGYHIEGRRWSETLLDQDLPPALRARTAVTAATMSYTEGDHEACERYSTEALDLARRESDELCAAYAWSLVGTNAMHRGEFETATSCLEKALQLFARVGEDGAVPMAQVGLGIVLLIQGNDDRATTMFEEALAVARRGGNRLATNMALYNLVKLALARGDHESAARMLKEGVRLSAQMGDRANLAYFIEGLAVVAGLCGDNQRSACLFGSTKVLLQDVGAPVYDYYEPDRAFYERTITNARSALGDAAFAEARERGREMTFEQAVEYALGRGEVSPT